jgi:hypothetical protein
VVKFGWERMECVLQGESSHAGNIKTTRYGLLVVVDHARTWKTDFCRSSGSKSGNARHDSRACPSVAVCVVLSAKIRRPYGMPYIR